MEQKTKTEGSTRKAPQVKRKRPAPKTLFYLYKYCRGGKDVKRGLGARDFTIESSYPKGTVLINWGGRFSDSMPASLIIINKPKNVGPAGDKFRFLSALAETGVSAPVVTDSLDTAMEWIEEGVTVFGRTKRGHSGLDIVMFQDDPLSFAKKDFWVKYKKKSKEFRVHVMAGEVILVQQKVLRLLDPAGNKIDPKEINFMVRSHSNGFIFKHKDVQPPEDVLHQALAAISLSKLDFGAVDVLWNDYDKTAYVLEVNTAPGLTGNSVSVYTEAFRKLLVAVRKPLEDVRKPVS